MSKRTLPDELRSVLLSHSLDAPGPDETMERILADTVAAQRDGVAGHRRWWRPSIGVVGAVACVALVVAGVTLVRDANNNGSNGSSSGSAAQFDQNAAAQASVAGPTRNGPMTANGNESPVASAPPLPDLDCSASLPGSRLVTGASTSFQATADTVFVFEFYCLGANGQRGGSQIEAFQLVSGKLQYLSTLVEAKKGSHLQSMVGAPGRVTLTGTSGDGQPSGELVSLTMDTQNDGLTFNGSTDVIAEPCQAKDLTSKVAKVEQISATNGQVIPGHFVLQLTNRASTPCALEGYPSLVGARDGKAAGPTLLQTLRGPAGGLTSSVPPIIRLLPGTTAGAIIESGPAHPPCAPTPQLKVTLANGVALGTVPVTLSGCGEQVHPFVNNPQGNG